MSADPMRAAFKGHGWLHSDLATAIASRGFAMTSSTSRTGTGISVRRRLIEHRAFSDSFDAVDQVFGRQMQF